MFVDCLFRIASRAQGTQQPQSHLSYHLRLSLRGLGKEGILNIGRNNIFKSCNKGWSWQMVRVCEELTATGRGVTLPVLFCLTTSFLICSFWALIVLFILLLLASILAKAAAPAVLLDASQHFQKQNEELVKNWDKENLLYFEVNCFILAHT